jgi:hypothetical protein
MMVGGEVTAPAAAMIGCHVEIVKGQWLVAPMSEESVAITVARRSCSPRGTRHCFALGVFGRSPTLVGSTLRTAPTHGRCPRFPSPITITGNSPATAT